MAHDVFISYSSQDRTTAYAMCATLEAKRIRCWIAPRDVVAGMNYAEALMEAISESRVMVLVFSSHSNRSQQVISELETAVSRGIPILPFRIENVPPTGPVEFHIRSRHWLDAWTLPLQRHLDQLAETVELLLSRAGTPPVVSREPEPPIREPAAPSPVLVELGTAGRALLRHGLAALRMAGHLLRYTASTVVRHPLPSALAAAGICAVILVALVVVAVLPGEGGNGSDNGRAGAVAPALTTTTPVTTNTPEPAATPSVARTTPTIAPKTPTVAPGTPLATQGASVTGGAPPMGQADEYALSASPECVASGGRLEVTWTAVERVFGDLIGLFPVSARNDQYAKYEWTRVGTAGGRLIFPAPDTAGEYEFRLIRDDTHLAVSDLITVEDGCPARSATAELEGYTLSASLECVAPGGRLEVTWTAVERVFGDLIGMFPVSARNDQYAKYEWDRVGTAGGRLIFPAPDTAGEYEFRLIRDDTHLATSEPITVSNDCGP